MESPLAELDAWWTDRGQDEEEFGTTVLRYLEEGESILVEFETVGGEDTAYPERVKWRLDVHDVQWSVWNWEYNEPEWHAEHPLLSPYDSAPTLISFAKPFTDPLHALGAVAKAHRELVGNWFPLERYFRTEMLESRFGQLASGPERFLAVYVEALRSVGEELSYVPLSHSWRTEEPLPSVVTWGRSYFIARSFRLERLG